MAYTRIIPLGEDVSAGGSVSADFSSTASSLESGYSSASDSSTPGGAVFQEASKRKFDTSDKTLKLLAEIAAAAAATAGCAAVGLGAAAPLCAWVGSKLGGAIYDGLKSVIGTLFGSDKAKKEIERRRNELDAGMKIMASEVEVYPHVRDLLDASVAALIVQHASLFPDAPKLQVLDCKKLLKATGLGLVEDVNNLTAQHRAGTCTPNDLIVPHFDRVILSGGVAKYATSVAQQCKLDESWSKASASDIKNRYNQVLQAEADWITNIQDATITVSSSLINLASNNEVQLLLQQSAELRAANSTLASNKDALIKELERRKQYEDYYLKIKRAAAAKRVAEEKAETERYLAAATETERHDKLLLGIAVGVVVVSAAAAVVISRRR